MSLELINYYHRVENQALRLDASTGRGLDRYLETLGDMKSSYEAHLKTHHWFTRVFLNLCWWKTSVHGAYKSCYHKLVDHVAKGYENKMMSLLACKHLLKDQIHRDFCAHALDRAISNTYQNKTAKGFVWTITNAHGVSSYLIGTVHQGTTSLGKAKGVQEAIQRADRFFTEKGLVFKFFKCAYYPLMTKDPRFLFILDRYIALEAHAKGKKTYVLDNHQLTKDTHKAAKEVRQAINLQFDQELPSSDYFNEQDGELKQNDLRFKKIISEISKVYLVQSINDQQRGELERDPIISESRQTLCDERTKAWLNHSFEKIQSDTPLPGLIAQINEAAKPICIAVGLMHCTGSKISLVEEFQKAGFKVERYDDK